MTEPQLSSHACMQILGACTRIRSQAKQLLSYLKVSSDWQSVRVLKYLKVITALLHSSVLGRSEGAPCFVLLASASPIKLYYYVRRDIGARKEGKEVNAAYA